MAAYASTVTSPLRRPKKVAEDNVMYRGSVNVTNYNSVLVEITDITGKFKGTPTVILGGASDTGHIVEWVPVSGSVKAYNGGTGVEAANDVDVGSVEFVAFGLG